VAETTVPVLVGKLEGKEKFGRAAVIDALAGFKDPRAADVLAQQLATNEWLQAGKALDDIGKKAAPAVTKQYFGPHGDGEKEARRLCMKWGVSEDTIVAQSVTALKASHAGTRRSAVEWLATATPIEARQAAVVDALLPLLGDKDRNIPRPTATAVGAWAGKDNVPALIAALNARDDGVRHPLIDALGRLKDERAAGPLADRLQGNFNKDRAKASDALVAIGPPAEKAVLKKLTERDLGTRTEVCRILKMIGTQESIAPLEKAKADKKLTAAADEAIQAIKERK
jgi:HEAT repeat protein